MLPYLLGLLVGLIGLWAPVQAQENALIQTTPKVRKKWFVEAGGGVGTMNATYQYSVFSSYLHRESELNALPYLQLKVGMRLQDRHLVSVGWERVFIANGFTYLRTHWGTATRGLGAMRDTRYEVFGLFYEYNLLRSKRFWLAPSVQLGLGFTDPTPHLWDSVGREQTYLDPAGMGPSTTHRFEMVQRQEAPVIFVYGLGWSTGVEIIDDRLYFGVEVKLVHSPHPRAKVYETRYTVDQEPPLIFETNNGIFNLNLGLRLRYEF